jgi:hypothetical protein
MKSALPDTGPSAIYPSMNPVTFDTFDATEYTRTPNIPTRTTVGLGRALLKLRPAQSNEVLDKAALRLESTLQELESALTDRLRSSNSDAPVREIDFDRATDGLWVSLRDRLTSWLAFEHQGLDALPPEFQEKAQLGLARKKAGRARYVHDRLFGSDGVAFVQQPYLEQAAAMGSLLRLIDADGHEYDLAELVGGDWLKLLRICQIRYEAMIDDRLARERGKSLNLATIRNKLRRVISIYNNAVITLLDEEVPETLDVVVTALRPMVRIRDIMNRPTGPSDEPTEDSVEGELLGTGTDELTEAAAE